MSDLMAWFTMHKQDLLALVLAHKWAAAFALFMASGLAANVLARVLNMVPLGGWYALVRVFFTGVSRAGNARFGLAVWKPFEGFLAGFILGTADAVRDGLDAGLEIAPPDVPSGPTAPPGPPAMAVTPPQGPESRPTPLTGA